MATVALQVGAIGLFAFLLVTGMMSKSGSTCGRGWLAFLVLPLAAAVSYSLLNNLLPQLGGADTGTDGAATVAPTTASPPSLWGYAVFLAFFQYLSSAIMTMVQKPNVPKFDVFRKSFISAGIIFVVAMLAIAMFKGASGPANLIGRIFPKTAGRAVTSAGMMSVALNPLVMLGALGAHGIACSFIN